MFAVVLSFPETIIHNCIERIFLSIGHISSMKINHRTPFSRTWCRRLSSLRVNENNKEKDAHRQCNDPREKRATCFEVHLIDEIELAVRYKVSMMYVLWCDYEYQTNGNLAFVIHYTYMKRVELLNSLSMCQNERH